MKTRKILFIILAIAFLFASGVIIFREWDGRKPVPALLETTTEAPVSAEVQATGTLMPTPDITSTEAPDVSPQDGTDEQSTALSAFGYITVCGKTFPIKKGVDESTLKGSIGWMESSARFGEEGLCVLMGHRNTQFRILRKISTGDVIVLTDSDGNKFEYTVQSAKIVESDTALRFSAGEGKRLVLVTCYPFVYQGHAPKKFCVDARIE